MEHVIDFKDFTEEKFHQIIDRAIEIKQNPEQYYDSLAHKKLYLLFEKTSTRTALSFSLAMAELGGTYFLQNWRDTNFTVGEFRDEVQYVGRNVDVIMARLKKNETLREFAKYSTVPVINGCCDKFHPSQILADLMAIKELFGTYQVKMLYIGVWNNVLNSLAESLPFLGGELYCMTPVINEASKDDITVNRARATGHLYELNPKMTSEDFKEIVKQMDILYTDSWVDMEFFHNLDFQDMKEERIKIMLPFQINKELLEGSKAIVLHDMPMHAGYEVSREVIEENKKYILQQAENRRHVEKGLLYEMLK